MYSCDITLASLQADRGEGFLSLLKRYVPDGEVSLTEGRPVSYLYPGWTNETIKLLLTQARTTFQEWSTNRDGFICAFMYNTILSIIGHPRPSEIAVKSNRTQSTTLDWGDVPKKLTKKTLNSKSPNVTPVYRFARVCDGCRQPERDGGRFMVCKKCNEKMSRQVYYCSRPCQISQWPIHKKICGKELTLAIDENPAYTEGSLAEAIFLLRRIGPARDGYVRSPALVRQIQYLDVISECDYVFFSPTGPNVITIPTFLLRLVFRLTIQTASVTGDSGCIEALSELVLQLCHGVPRFLDQFVAEYGIVAASAAQDHLAGRTKLSAKSMDRWGTEFLASAAGSKYANIAENPANVPESLNRRSGYERDLSEVPSFEVTRNVITDLRKWWPQRS
ncbi:hypothetical protein K438DRAFT_373994 [Mycena galopus ATCC 62051]|nr:hypothetical protein K438DRAFT_373994 [Mycena galopus ATCC 62051]